MDELDDSGTFTVSELRAAVGLAPLTDSQCSSDSELCDSTGESQELEANESYNQGRHSPLTHHPIAVLEPVTEVDVQLVKVEIISENNHEVFHGDLQSGRKRRKKAQPGEWKRNRNKRLRMQGMDYQGFQNVSVRMEDGTLQKKTIQAKIKPQKEIGPPCTSLNCQRARNALHCQDISEDNRKRVHMNFWKKMDWGQKKLYVCFLVDYIEVKKKTTGTDSRRAGTYIYHIKDENQKKLRVCKKLFMSTLGISEKQIRNWTKKSSSGVKEPSPQGSNRKIHAPIRGFLKSFFENIPKMPSHYCRNSTTKLYVEPVYNSLSQLFSAYKEKCEESAMKPVSRCVFSQVFSEMNLSFFTPKKDQCDTCCAYRTGNIPEEDWKLHDIKKQEARLEKQKDKTDALEGKCYILTMDVESVKMSPCLKASALYFKTKLAVHNFTVYNISNHHATCFWWNETEAELVASTFATCLVDYLSVHCTDNIPIIVFSDGCPYQNRNSIMSNALLCFSMNSGRVIFQKFLEKGHTQMECDSVHSAIETKLKNRDIHLPSDYATICKEARRNPSPYEVKYLTHDYFRDFSKKDFMRYPSIRPGKKAGDDVVNNLRQIKYDPAGKIYFKLQHSDIDWKELPTRPRNLQPKLFPPLYNRRLKISDRKWKDLQDLKPVLPSDCHSFYNELPH